MDAKIVHKCWNCYHKMRIITFRQKHRKAKNNEEDDEPHENFHIPKMRNITCRQKHRKAKNNEKVDEPHENFHFPKAIYLKGTNILLRNWKRQSYQPSSVFSNISWLRTSAIWLNYVKVAVVLCLSVPGSLGLGRSPRSYYPNPAFRNGSSMFVMFDFFAVL